MKYFSSFDNINKPIGELNKNWIYLQVVYTVILDIWKKNLVTFRKEFRGRTATTIYSITEKGFEEFTKLRERLFKVSK
jgi:DNA-binding PadR family transcriptional regulator